MPYDEMKRFSMKRCKHWATLLSVLQAVIRWRKKLLATCVITAHFADKMEV
jgi:hypothetical protein